MLLLGFGVCLFLLNSLPFQLILFDGVLSVRQPLRPGQYDHLRGLTFFDLVFDTKGHLEAILLGFW